MVKWGYVRWITPRTDAKSGVEGGFMIETTSSRLTMKEAAHYLGHSYSWLFSRHRTLGLNGYRIGGRWFFDLADIQEWEANLKPQKQLPESQNYASKSKLRSVQFV